MNQPMGHNKSNTAQNIEIKDHCLVSIGKKGKINNLFRNISNKEIMDLNQVPKKSIIFFNNHAYNPSHNFDLVQTQMINFNEISSIISKINSNTNSKSPENLKIIQNKQVRSNYGLVSNEDSFLQKPDLNKVNKRISKFKMLEKIYKDNLELSFSPQNSEKMQTNNGVILKNQNNSGNYRFSKNAIHNKILINNSIIMRKFAEVRKMEQNTLTGKTRLEKTLKINSQKINDYSKGVQELIYFINNSGKQKKIDAKFIKPEIKKLNFCTKSKSVQKKEKVIHSNESQMRAKNLIKKYCENRLQQEFPNKIKVDKNKKSNRKLESNNDSRVEINYFTKLEKSKINSKNIIQKINDNSNIDTRNKRYNNTLRLIPSSPIQKNLKNKIEEKEIVLPIATDKKIGKFEKINITLKEGFSNEFSSPNSKKKNPYENTIDLNKGEGNRATSLTKKNPFLKIDYSGTKPYQDAKEIKDDFNITNHIIKLTAPHLLTVFLCSIQYIAEIILGLSESVWKRGKFYGLKFQ